MSDINRNIESTIFDFVNNDSKDVYFRINSNGELSYINRAVENYGYKVDELIGNPVLDYIFLDDREIFTNQMKLRLEGRLTSETINSRFLTKSGEVRYFEIISNPVNKRFSEGEVISQGIARDVTEKVEIDNILHNLTDGKLGKLSGSEFLFETSKYISEKSGLDYIFIGEYNNQNQIKTLALTYDGKVVKSRIYDLGENRSDKILDSSESMFSNDIQKDFPDSRMLKKLKIETYLEVPLINSKNDIIGLLVGLSRESIDNKNYLDRIFQLFKVPISLNLENMKLVENIVDGYSKMLEYMDPYTLDHQNEVAELSVKIGENMGLSLKELETLNFAAKLHDIGKSGIPNQILSKPGKLTENEFLIVKDHPNFSYDIIKDVEFNCDDVAEVVLQHHEKLDGSGYPRGLKGSQIHKLAKILSVADVFNAMANDRPYRKALSLESTLEELIKNKGKKFCPEVVETLQNLYNLDQKLFVSQFCKRN